MCLETDIVFRGESITQKSEKIYVGNNYNWNLSDVEIHCYIESAEEEPSVQFFPHAYANPFVELNDLVNSLDATLVPRNVIDCNYNDIECNILDHYVPDKPKSNDDPEGVEINLVEYMSDLLEPYLPIVGVISFVIMIISPIITLIRYLRKQSWVKDKSHRQLPITGGI